MNIAVTLDINKPEAGQRIRLRRGEVNSTVLSFVVNEGGVRVDLTGFTEVLFCAQKDDGIIIDPLTVSEEGECMYSLPASLASIAGEVRLAYLELRKEDYRATTDTIIFEVLEAVNSDEVAASYVPKLDSLIDDINEFRAEVEEEEATRKSNEEARVEAEKGRVTAETGRASAEDDREEAEADRASAEAGRVSAESGRVNAESSRATAESARDDAEDARVNAESARATAESGRVTAESARVQAENKRQADFAEIVDTAQGFKTQILTAGQYDPDTLEPTIMGNPGIIYLVPVGEEATEDNHYKEFLYLSNAWEYIGTTNTTITPISTDTIDEIIAEQTKTGSETLNTTGLSYFFFSLWAKAKGAFASLAGATFTGEVRINAGSTSHVPFRVYRKLASGEVRTNALGVGSSDCGVVQFQKDGGEVVNTLSLYADRSELNKPLTVASGGTGAATASDALTNLGAAPEAQAVPTGGTEGQLLTKTADSFGWADAPDGLPDGGTSGQVLTKTDSGADWLDVPEAPETQMQAGVIYPYGGDSAAVPYGYLLCDGAAVSRATYAALFAVIGTSYGEGDGSTTFNLPDLRARMPFGEGEITEDSGAYEFWRGNTGGSVKHRHEYGVSYNEGYGAVLNPFALYDYGTNTWQKPTHNGSSQTTKPTTISAGGSENLFKYENFGNTNTEIGMPPFVVVNYIINTGMTGSQAEAFANITIGTDKAPATGVPGSIYIQML